MADMLDPEKSEYQTKPITFKSLRQMRPVRGLVVRPDASPVHELFYDRTFRTLLLCSDVFAERILRAGCTGMAFIDPNGYGSGKDPHLRTLDSVK
jgi:hypothetical protein